MSARQRRLAPEKRATLTKPTGGKPHHTDPDNAENSSAVTDPIRSALSPAAAEFVRRIATNFAAKLPASIRSAAYSDIDTYQPASPPGVWRERETDHDHA